MMHMHNRFIINMHRGHHYNPVYGQSVSPHMDPLSDSLAQFPNPS